MKRYQREFNLGKAGFFGLAALLGMLVLLVPGLRAEDHSEPGSAPPARALRLSYVDGDVHLYHGAEMLAEKAVANTPLFEGARVDTGNDGRAEIQFEDGSVARISPQSSLTLSVLQGLSASSERNAQIVLNSGLGYFELQGESENNHLKVRFGDTEVTAAGVTVLRINLDKAPGEVAVFSGNAHLEGGAGPTLDLHGGESLALNATDPSSYNVAETIEPDTWDTWNSDRDQELSTVAANRTEATESQPDQQNPAWNDLDANGNWYDVPDQGYVWTPNEASNPDWDPYGNGYWMNSPSYGYMWISGYPWGYLPYQCGAWNYYQSFGWGWAPGGYCNPWWGGGGGWIINIHDAPPRYRYPVRPRPRNPRPVAGHEPAPRTLIAVHRNEHVHGNVMLAPRDKSRGTVMIAGHTVNPLRPIPQHRVPYHPIQVGARPGPNQPGMRSNPQPVFQGGNSTPRPIGVPARPGTTYTPAPQPRPGTTYTPPRAAQPGGYYSRPAPPVQSAPPVRIAPPPPAPRVAPAPVPRMAPAPAPRSAPPPSMPSHPSGGGGGGRPAAGPHR